LELQEAIRERRSVRKWLEKKIPEKTINQLIDAASWAPSSCNRQAVKILAVQEKEGREFLGRITNGGVGFAHKAPLLLLFMADSRVYSLPVERHTPHLDCAAAIQNLLLKAHELGLGAVWLNWCLNQKSEAETYKRFKIPAYFTICSLVAAGYPAIKAEDIPRKPLEQFFVREKF